MTKDSKLTTENYWDSTYGSRRNLRPISLNGYKNYCARIILSKKRPLVDKANSILEIGGGGSSWLAYLAREYPDKRFSSLDFSEKGNELLRSHIAYHGLHNIEVHEGDFFLTDMGGQEFDFIYSHGVVEHFRNLPGVLSAHSRFLSGCGKMLTIIPNMAGILGLLTRKMNKEVYDIHVPHNLQSLERGHLEAGLQITESGYLCSSNFGVLSSCITKPSGLKHGFYKQLTRASKLVWLFEDKVFDLPTSRVFSPYLYVISEKGRPDVRRSETD
jgi:2-polyprenyl-3-methyl-5-hydroxy-6-metoxy-1,4-benzoquinol methylase